MENNFLNKSKRAQGMSTTTIILLILGLVVLVVLILGFTMGWNRLLPFAQNSNNIGSVKAACNIACSAGNDYEYCAVMRDVSDGNNPSFEETCNNLATSEEYEDRFYGIASCPQVDCSSVEQ